MQKSDITNMKEAFGFGSRLFKGFKDGEDMLTKLESLGNYEEELTRDIEALTTKRTKLVSDTDAAVEQLAKVKADSSEAVKAASTEAAELLESAVAEAKDIVAAAQGEADTLRLELADDKAALKALKEEIAQLSEERTRLENAKAEALAMVTGALKG